MVLFALVGMLIGAILGIRLTVLALVPVMMGALAIAVAGAATGDGAFGPTMNGTVLVLTGLQIGYLAGAAACFRRRKFSY
jgi:hypothetical protein